MEEALLSLLKADAGLTAAAGGRISWGRRPQGQAALPAITLNRINGRRDHNMSGANGLVDSLVQVDIYGEHYDETKLTARALMSVINGYSGTVSGTHFQRISIDTERDSSETGSSDRHLHRVSLDLSIWHDE